MSTDSEFGIPNLSTRLNFPGEAVLSQDKISGKVDIPFATLLIGFILTAVSVTLVLWLRNWQAPLDEILKVVATGVGATTATYAAMSLARLNRAHIETVELKKLELTAKFIERWQDPKTAEAALPLALFIRDHRALSPDEIAKKIDADNALAASALYVLNTLEALAVELKYGALQPEMAKAFFRGVVTTYYSSMSGLIVLARTRKSNPRLFVELEALVNQWMSK